MTSIYSIDEKKLTDITNTDSDQIITIDMSSPNIAKPMSMEHLRSTLIGNTLSNVLTKQGYKTVKINHIGDWGYHLGKILLAIDRWGDRKQIESDPQPLQALDELYREYFRRLQFNPYLEEESAQLFSRLTYGDEAIIEQWQWLVRLSLEHFSQIYETLGITFDSIRGESCYQPFVKKTLERMRQAKESRMQDGVLLLTIAGEDIRVLDQLELSTYLTRDLAAAVHRYETYQFDRALYVVAQEQTEHFQQLTTILGTLDYSWATDIVHVPFSSLTTPQPTVPQLLKEAKNMDPSLLDTFRETTDSREMIRSKLAVGTIIYTMLSHQNEESFQLENTVQPSMKPGHLGYILNLINEVSRVERTGDENEQPPEALTQCIDRYPATIQTVQDTYDPSHLTHYLNELSQLTSKYFYNKAEHDKINMTVIHKSTQVLTDGLALMGIKTING
ncbi:arginine--tRNA ligase [Dolosigranulum pigrum]|uniref:arginine--tRNA ligase domain-containing protein n=1 Tax=Dolosigranulum pigrum TaxID=29394 RepID=UPI00370D2250